MLELERINQCLQDRLQEGQLEEVTATTAARWLAEAGLLRDSDAQPGSPLRQLLRAGQILGAHQRPDRPQGRWWIRRTPSGYHAHVYYDDARRADAAAVRDALGSAFPVKLGRWRDEPVGPHPAPMYQVAFAAEDFGRIVPWLMLNRRELTILVHPETGEAVGDHSDRALWMGQKLALRLNRLG